MAVNFARAEEVGPALLRYIEACTKISGIDYAEPPEAIVHGWETYIFSFLLRGDGLDRAWTRPLILRVYPGADQGPKAEREAAVQRFAVERGYPAPRPLAVETDSGVLGLPFMVMERAPGEPMLDRMTKHPLSVGRLARLMADMHVALHELPVNGCPLPSDGSLIERSAREFEELAGRSGLELPSDVQRAFDWLLAHRSAVIPEEVSLCHHDFHPLNLLVDDEGGVTVLDWPSAALGDRHSDIASTLVLLRTAPAEPRSFLERIMLRFGRGVLVWFYLRRYRQQLPIDRERLRYWEAVRSFEWWMRLTAFEAGGSAAVGVKEETAERIPLGHVNRMRRYFWQRARDEHRARPVLRFP